MPVWDTSVASSLHPESRLFEFAAAKAMEGEPVLIAAATVAEISYGLKRKDEDPRFADALAWFGEVFEAGGLEVLPLTRQGAQVTGLLRAIHPLPPPPGKKDRRSKPDRRVAWVNDIQIAVSAWLRAEPVCTMDQSHFESLSRALAEQYPGTGELEVISPPA
jgi:predicted nucleic acid-binding protein